MSQTSKRVTPNTLRKMKESGVKIVMMTAYDFPSAELLDAAGIDVILVGDSLGTVTQGKKNTLSVTLDEMIYHTELVVRAARRALVGPISPSLTRSWDRTTLSAPAPRYSNRAAPER